MDFVLVDHNSAVGEISQRHNYTGMFEFVTMDLSVTVLCAPNFQGADCTQCIQAEFTGPNCDGMDDCVGVDCVNGVCVDGLNSYSCTCDPGFTGELCQTNIPNTNGTSTV